jgi:predicted amidophosphoribosyltransferase
MVDQGGFCTECGAAVSSKDKFCAGCGHNLGGGGVPSSSTSSKLRASLQQEARAPIVTEYEDKAGTSASHIKNHDRPQYDRALADMGSAYEVILSWRSNRLVRVGMRMLLLDFQEDALSGALLDQPVVRFLSGGQPWVHCASWGSR